MTGQPAYTFRERVENPVCQSCGEEMEKRETVETPVEEQDVYECGECRTEFVDRWSY